MLNFAIKCRDRHKGLAELQLHCALLPEKAGLSIGRCLEKGDFTLFRMPIINIKKNPQRIESWRFGCSGSCVCFDVCLEEKEEKQ